MAALFCKRKFNDSEVQAVKESEQDVIIEENNNIMKIKRARFSFEEKIQIFFRQNL